MLLSLGLVVAACLLTMAQAASCVQTAPSNDTQVGLYYCPDQQVYLAQVQLGSPAQTLQFMIDMQNPATVVPLPTCQGMCPQTTFKNSTSSTFVLGDPYNETASGSQPTLLSSVAGNVGYDYLSMNPVINSTYRTQIVWMTNGNANQSGQTMPYDGVLGLAPSYINDKVSFENLMNQAMGNQVAFAIELQPKDFASVIYVQPYPSSLLNSLQYIPGQNNYQYVVTASGIFFGGSGNIIDQLTTSGQFTMSSYLPSIYFQEPLFNNYYKNYLPNCTLYGSYLLCPQSCSSLAAPAIRIDLFGGIALNIPASNFTSSTSDTQCKVQLSSVSASNPNILGLPFMYNYVVALSGPGSFDTYNIGFSGNTQPVYFVGIGQTLSIMVGQAVCLGLLVIVLLGAVVMLIATARIPVEPSYIS